MTNVLYNTTISDMETCYKLFDRRVLEGIVVESERFDFEPEITAKILRRVTASTRCRSPTAAGNSDEGKKITWRDGFGALRTLVRYRFARV